MKGGARAGAGRKPVENKKVQIFFSVTKEQKENKELILKIKNLINNSN
jgi:hypothetical protein